MTSAAAVRLDKRPFRQTPFPQSEAASANLCLRVETFPWRLASGCFGRGQAMTVARGRTCGIKMLLKASKDREREGGSGRRSTRIQCTGPSFTW
eukprot:5744525-Pleurochrysis_carterae.AAC.2